MAGLLERRGRLTFGAVVLTLNATEFALLLVIWSVRLTDWVNGPAQSSSRIERRRGVRAAEVK